MSFFSKFFGRNRPPAWQPAELFESFGPSLIQESHGIPHLNFSVAEPFIQEKAEGEQAYWWNQAITYWLQALNRSLGGDGQIVETANFLLIHFLSDIRFAYIIEPLEKIRTGLLQDFEGVARDHSPGKNLLVILPDSDSYYSYISRFYPDGTFGQSAGVQIRSDYPHIALHTSETEGISLAILAHEMTHLYTGHLELPAWLDEALALSYEEKVDGPEYSDLDMRQRLIAKHHELWNPRTIQDFWFEHTFSDEEFQDISYDLAKMLFNKLTRVRGVKKPELLQFIREADYRDSGNAAAQKHLGVSLGALVESFLGPGEWEPRHFQ